MADKLTETVERLRELLAKATTPNTFDWYFPWRVQPSDGKPIIVGARSGNLFRGFIGTWDEADLIVETVNALPLLLAALTPAGEDEGLGITGKANRNCLEKARPGEPAFIILGRDPDGGNIVRLWAERRKAAGDADHAEPVFAIADAMDAWAANPANAPESAPPPLAYAALSRPNVDEMREALELPPLIPGEERAFRKCSCGEVGWYDYVPYSLSNSVAVMKCGHDAKSARWVSEDEFRAALNGSGNHG